VTLLVRLLKDGDQELLERVDAGVFDRDVDPRWADAFLRDPRHHLVAAIADDRIVGFVSALDYWHPDKPRELWINEVGVASAWRRRGVGTQLMQATLDHARALGCFEAWVLTDSKNPAALALYHKVGGAQSGTDLVMFTFVFRQRPPTKSARRNAAPTS
jgi:aminoglycoside 6'-N-acetyltransferase I